MAFAPIYDCPTCGEVWKVSSHEEIDCDRDEIYTHMVCDVCGREVCEKLIDGTPCYHALTEEEIIDETTDWSNPESEDDDD